MKTQQAGTFAKVGQCLYRYSSNGVYYAFVRHEGNLKRKSLETVERAVANRKLADYRRDLGRVDSRQGKLTLRELCARYLGTVQNQSKATVERKKRIVKRLLENFPGGADLQVGKVKPSDFDIWLAKFDFGYASHNLYVECVQAIFDMAVADKVLADSPAKNARRKKVVKPVRLTPTIEEFQQIIENVRSQEFNDDAEDSGDFLEFMGLIGVGQAEASRIQKQHVNLAKGQLTFFRRKTRKPYVVPIFPQAAALVGKLTSKPDMARTDTLLKIQDAKHALANACRRLGFPAYSQRALRRMFVTRAIEKGIDVKVIADWQGHADGGKLILGTYSHVRNAHSDSMAKLMIK